MIYELEANASITITGPAVIAVSPPAPRGAAPGYDPERDPQLEIMSKALKALGYDLVVVPREGIPPQNTQGRYPAAKTRQEGPLMGEPDK